MSGQSNSATLLFRSDLIGRRIRMGKQFFWVLKDPLSRAYFYVTDREHAILSLLDGRRRLAEIAKECSTRFAPEYVSAESITHFLADAKSNGLINVMNKSSFKAESEVARPNAFARRPWVSSWLAVRLPGLNPDGWLDLPAKLLRPCLGITTAVLCVLMLCLAILIAITRFDQLGQHIVVSTGRTGLSWWLTIAAVIAATKVIHELAHALACKVQGAECRELGVMFLVGVPCLYCDVSDAWMLPDRFKRIFVSAAGMMAELMLASLAIFLWSVSEPGVFRDICVTVAVVCSVSTVLFNGNPLLRYDGYFILSDWIGAPNLAAESRRLISDSCKRVIWALPKVDVGDVRIASPGIATLVAYGILSGVYRCFVMAAIALLGYRLMAGLGLESVGLLLMIMLVVMMVWQVLGPLLRKPSHAIRRSSTARSRRWIAGIVVAAILVGAMIPLPRKVVAPMMIQLADFNRVYVDSPGAIVTAVSSGAVVKEGDLIVTLKNSEHDYRLAQAVSEQEMLRTRLNSLTQQVVGDSSVAAQVEVAGEQLQAVEMRITLLRNEHDKLVVRAPASGVFYAPPRQTRKPNKSLLSNSRLAQVKWQGVPLEKKNLGAYLDRGTLLGAIGDKELREAVLLVRQQEIASVALGQDVSVLLSAVRAGSVRGRITDISAAPIEEVPAELVAAGWVRPAYDPITQQPANETYYQVRVQLNNATPWLAIRSTGQATIGVAAESLLTRLRRALSETFAL